MLPIVNGKLLFDCEEEDLQVLVDNPDYRENEELDYKENFAFLELDKRNPDRLKLLAEFRSDICSFANAGGGYIVYGISDNRGMAAEIVGVDIPEGNTDKFELERKNNMNSILPKIPPVRFRFIRLQSNKYVVIIHIVMDYFSPYIHLENEKDYRIYKRVGNGKRAMSYIELKSMFSQSMLIEKEIQTYRKERVSLYQKDEKFKENSQFLLLHIFPDTFKDINYNKNLFLLERQGIYNFKRMFGNVDCSSASFPNMDGLRFPNPYGKEQCYLGNNGVAEVYFPLERGIDYSEEYPKGRFAAPYVWEKIQPVIEEYVDLMKNVFEARRLFLCVSIIGCQDMVTEEDAFRIYVGKIDRDEVMCYPVVVENMHNAEYVSEAIKHLQMEFYLALGMKNSKGLKELIKEVYQIEIN